MMRFRLLGPLEVRAGEGWRGIGAPKWRSVLATLLIDAGQIVPADRLISEVWGDAPPAKAPNLISIYVLRLRRLMDDADRGLLVTRAPGYQLRVTASETDALLFETMVREGRRAFAAGDPKGAASQLTEALALWYGQPLADVPPTPLVEAEAERLTELRLGAIELRITAELACGGHAQAVSEIRRLLADHPLQEGLWLLLMRALDGAGRHAEALEVYGQARSAISGQLGVDPGAELRQLHAELLAKDHAGPPGVITAGLVTTRPSRQAPAAPPTGPAERPGNTEGAERPANTESAAAAGSRPGRRPRSAVPAPAQLPAGIADFTGRDEQVKRLGDLLSGRGANSDPGAVRIAVVAGAGGLGKTSLAVHAAHRVRRKFPDGQLYVDLLGATPSPLPTGDVLARFLRDLGMDGRDIPVDEDERAARYRTTLAGRRMLVVLDNARDAAQVRPLLPGTASCSVLVTTRSRMPELASNRLVDLNVLGYDEALALFVKIVGEERAAAEPVATDELLDACAGLPLAIRICAARLAARAGWTIRSMADRLRDTRRRLDELRVGDLAVRASFQVSFTSLPGPAEPAGAGIGPAGAFRLLGLWPGPSISAAAAAALFGTPEYLAADALEALVDAHLLESLSPDRYHFHDLLRVYASERAQADLSGQDRDAGLGRLLGWYVRAADGAAEAVSPHRYSMPLDPVGAALAAPRFATADDALAWYDDERANVIAATRVAAAAGLHDVAWRLPVPLLNIFDRRGAWADCITTHRIALDSARRAGNRQGEAWVLNNLGEALCINQESEGISYLEQAVRIRREIGDRRGEAQAVGNLADAFERLGRTAEAIDLLQQARDLNRLVGNRYGEGVALVNLGAALLDQGHAEEAVGHLEQAHSTFAEIGYLDGVGYGMHYLGECHLSLGRDADAMDCLHEAVISHQAAGSRHQQALTLRSLGGVQARNGLADEARQSWAQAVTIFNELGDLAQAAQVRDEQVASGIS
jgi:DNA-binding SARP family transcriptional activator